MGRTSYTSNTVSFLVQQSHSLPWYKATQSSAAWYDDPSHHKHPATATPSPYMVAVQQPSASTSATSSNARPSKDAPTLWAHNKFDPDDEALPSIEERFLDPHEVIAHFASSTSSRPRPVPQLEAVQGDSDIDEDGEEEGEDDDEDHDHDHESSSEDRITNTHIDEFVHYAEERVSSDNDGSNAPITLEEASRRMLANRAQQWGTQTRDRRNRGDDDAGESGSDTDSGSEYGQADEDQFPQRAQRTPSPIVAQRQGSGNGRREGAQGPESGVLDALSRRLLENNNNNNGNPWDPAVLDSQAIVELASAFLRQPQLAEHGHEHEQENEYEQYSENIYGPDATTAWLRGNEIMSDRPVHGYEVDVLAGFRGSLISDEEAGEGEEYQTEEGGVNDADDVIGGYEAFIDIDEQVIDRRSTPSIADDFSPSAGVFHTHTLPFNLPNMGEMQMQRRSSDRIVSSSIGGYY